MPGRDIPKHAPIPESVPEQPCEPSANETADNDFNVDSPEAAHPIYNRVAMLMAHTARYAFEPQARLAKDVGVARSTISRILSGKRNPTLPLALKIVTALEESLGVPLDSRDVFSPDGTYPTRSGCKVAGCKGCMPEAAYDRHGNLRPAYYTARPGDWTLEPAPTSPTPDDHK